VLKQLVATDKEKAEVVEPKKLLSMQKFRWPDAAARGERPPAINHSVSLPSLIPAVHCAQV
jgi:hypothetical protein